jgi:AraC-like DNA-binding protein
MSCLILRSSTFLLRARNGYDSQRLETAMNLESLLKLAQKYHLEQEKRGFGLERLSVYTRTQKSELESYIYEPVICLILQGGKETTSGNQVAYLREGDALLVSHVLPVLSRITDATPDRPYVALILSLDLQLIRALYSEVGNAPVSSAPERSLSSGKVQSEWLEPLERYLGLAKNPLDAKILGPALLREIHYRLVTSSIGAMLRNLMVVDSHASRIARATHRLRLEFRSPIRVETLAKETGMSVTTFHTHFKDVTGTTPLQYQKELRLTEARNLLSTNTQKVGEVAFNVGYESPAQFSRDYSRKFGHSPREQAMPLRQN